MAWQLIYTSAPRGLLSGQSGFCTVARSADLREALVQRLEQISSYHHFNVGTREGNPAIRAFRTLDIRGARYHVLTRIDPCGLDFTSRNNHLAHHLVFEPAELAHLPSPALLLRDWRGWVCGWNSEPRLLPELSLDEFAGIEVECLPARTWLETTGDAGRAAGLLEAQCARGCFLVCPWHSEERMLEMFCETLALLNLTGQHPVRPWRHPFTNFLQGEDAPGDFHWRACQEGTPACEQARQRSASLLPLEAVPVPINLGLVKIAREGRKPPAPPGSEPLSVVRASGVERTDRGENAGKLPLFEEPLPRKRERYWTFTLPLDSNSLARVGIFVAALVILIGVKMHLKPHQAPEEAERVSQAVVPQPNPVPERARPEASSNPPQLEALWAEGPTYVLFASNLEDFTVPPGPILRLQHLIRQLDGLAITPSNISFWVGTNKWDCSSETAAPLYIPENHLLAARHLDCVFDYSAWIEQGNGPVKIHIAAEKPQAVSLRFGPSADPFRLLAIAARNPPPPVLLPKPLLQEGQGSLESSLQPEILRRWHQIHVLDGAKWQMRPFIKLFDGQVKFLYQDWPVEDLPPAGDELDFAGIRKRMAMRATGLQSNAIAADKKFRGFPRADFDFPLGKGVGASNELTSFAQYARGHLSPVTFVEYLQALGKAARHHHVTGWPAFQADDDADELAGKFQKLYNRLIEIKPDTKVLLAVNQTNYFYNTWHNLAQIEPLQVKAEQANSKYVEVKARLDSVPESLAGTAWVSLCIMERQRPVEVLRFQGF